MNERIQASIGMASAILTEASLSFLGLGVKPPTADWGDMLSRGRAFMNTAWWLSTFPGLAIVVIVMAINRFGDGLRDALDQPAVLKLREVLASATWQQTLQTLPGYGADRAGQVLSLTQALPWWRFRVRKSKRTAR
jgi:hypothetical protein